MEKLLTTKEVAEAFGISDWTLREKRRHEEGPPYLKIGGAVRYRPSEVEAWLSSCAARPGATEVA